MFGVATGSTAWANSDPVTGLTAGNVAAGLGAAVRIERSPYSGVGTRYDLVPLYLYEGKHLYLHATRAGVHLDSGTKHRFDIFVAHRFEGFPYEDIPASLAGMSERDPGIDVGIGYEYRGAWGAAYAELLQGAAAAARGTELRLGYRHEWRSARFSLRPHVTLGLRNATLNNYYYGVRPAEALATRPAYEPGAGVNLELGLFGAYAVTERLRLLAGVTATRWSRGVRQSPIVDDRTTTSYVLGLMYDFSPEHKVWPENSPVLVRLMAGQATNCNVAKVVQLRCTSTDTTDQTRIYALEVGRTFIERLNDWPLDVAGYVGLLRHDERGVQPDFWQVNAYLKPIWYGFPWSDRVMTRIGMGVGVSYARGVPMMDRRKLTAQGRNTSRLLNYLDPTIDVSVGDILGVRSLKRTFVGMGVSHRSGIFGSSQLLGNVDGGSNYIYGYVEWGL